jgi:hypothetical protein
MFSVGAPSDPFYRQELDNGHIANNRTGLYTLRSPRRNPGDRELVLIVAGQSNSANYMGGSYTVFYDSKVDTLNYLDGGIYNTGVTILGADGTQGNWLGRLGDIFIDYGDYDHVTLVPVSAGNSFVADWDTGNLRFNILVAQRRCSSLGLLPTAILWQQGENDVATSQATYAARLSSVINRSRFDGLTVPWFLGKSTYAAGVANPTVRAAIDSLVNGVDVLAGADTDTLTGTENRTAELTHFNLAGGIAAAALWRTAILAAIT